MAAEKTRDPTKKFTFSVRTRTLFWRRAEDDGKAAAPAPRRVTLGQLPFLPHSAETLNGLSRLDRACLAFLRFVVARRVLACCAIAGLYAVLAGAGICVEIIKVLRRVRAESSRRPLRHRRDACSMAWRCRFLAARRSQDGSAIAEKCTRRTG